MTGANPIVTTPPPTTSGTSSSSSVTNQSLEDLGPDAFITLLTAQLQAQDPLDPMDPDQMVNELTEMNTLQETIQMRTDLDTLVSDAGGTSGTSGTGGGGTGTSAAVSAQNGTNTSSGVLTPGMTSAVLPTSTVLQAAAPHHGSPTTAVPVIPHVGAGATGNTLASGLSAFTRSLSPKSVSGIYSQFNSKTGLN
jgi:flagellar basal-body rod modification protein FlgD